jgi:hypothetical protein
LSYQFRATEKFWKNFHDLPNNQKELVRQKWQIFKVDPFEPSLLTHQIRRLSAKAKHTIYSVATTELPKFTVFLDSCCLCTQNDSEIVDYKFTQLLRELSSKCDLQLAVPRAVIRELLSRKTFRCGIFLDKAKSGLKQIEKSTHTDLNQPPTIKELQATLEKR